MSGLVEFLRARLDEDEQFLALLEAHKQRVAERNADAVAATDQAAADLMKDPAIVVVLAEMMPLIEAGYRPPNDLARFRAEIATKRAILDEHERVVTFEDYGHMAMERVLEILTQPYADHPDFDPAWRLDVSPL